MNFSERNKKMRFMSGFEMSKFINTKISVGHILSICYIADGKIEKIDNLSIKNLVDDSEKMDGSLKKVKVSSKDGFGKICSIGINKWCFNSHPILSVCYMGQATKPVYEIVIDEIVEILDECFEPLDHDSEVAIDALMDILEKIIPVDHVKVVLYHFKDINEKRGTQPGSMRSFFEELSRFE